MREYEKRRVRVRSRAGTPRGPKTVCKNGHPYTAENTYVRPDGERECRACKRISRRQSDTKRRALLAGVFIENVNPYVVLVRDGGICQICHVEVDPLRFHVDHIVAIANGGWHCYDNVQLAHPTCNLRKGVS